MTPALRRRLAGETAASYRPAGRFARYFALGKLLGDPVFPMILERGLIPDGARLLDPGCGQGLLGAWLLAARRIYQQGGWPACLPEPPVLRHYQGIERRPAEALRARRALGADAAAITTGDLLSVRWPEADVIVLLDVLHYLNPEAQSRVLRRARESLPPRGRLLLRVGDAAGGWRHRWSEGVDRAVAGLRGDGWERLHGRAAEDWVNLLDALGFGLEALPLRQGFSFSNRCYLAWPRFTAAP